MRLHNLREHLVVHRLISINVPPGDFFAYVQRTAVQQIALELCKIYELNGSHSLNSLDGTIKALEQEKFKEAWELEMIRDLKRTHGSKKSNPGLILAESLEKFMATNRSLLNELITFRDKVVAHAQANYSQGDLPSHDEFELLLNFAEQTCSTVDRFVQQRSLDSNHVKYDLLSLMRKVGIKDPQVLFLDER